MGKEYTLNNSTWISKVAYSKCVPAATQQNCSVCTNGQLFIDPPRAQGAVFLVLRWISVDAGVGLGLCDVVCVVFYRYRFPLDSAAVLERLPDCGPDGCRDPAMNQYEEDLQIFGCD